MVDDFESALAAADSTPVVEEVIEPTTETVVATAIIAIVFLVCTFM